MKTLFRTIILLLLIPTLALAENANWNKPDTSSTASQLVSETRALAKSAATMDFTGDTNLPSVVSGTKGPIQYNRSTNQLEEILVGTPNPREITNLKDGAVSTTAKIADNTVTSAKIVDGTIASGDLGSNSVTTVKITDSNVTTAKIADSNVTTAKIADSNVTTAKIADSNVTSAKIADGTIALADLGDTAVQSDQKVYMTFSSYSPSITGCGGMSTSGTTQNGTPFYTVFGKSTSYGGSGRFVFYSFNLSFTVDAGTLTSCINVGLPLSTHSTWRGSASCWVYEGAIVPAMTDVASSASTMQVYKTGNWTAGAGKGVICSGFHRVD